MPTSILDKKDIFRDSVATISKEGKRNFINPKKPKGRLYNLRTRFSIFYLIVFFSLPFFKVNGEPLLMEAGDALSLVDVPDSSPAAGAARVALSTCYDLRFPELYRAQLDAGATLFVIPAAWPAARVRHWTLLAHARAIENQCVVVACNTAGTHAGVEMAGHSQVVLPAGDVAAMAGREEQVLSVEVDMSVVSDYRTSFPVLRDRRLPLGPG